MGKQAPLYTVWINMRARCSNPNLPDYVHYGGRGIEVCRSWLDSFAVFEKWAVASGYKHGLTIERINNDGNYTPKNCRWATRAEQSRNTRSTRMVAAFGERKCIMDWLRDPRCVAQSRSALYARLRRGWPAERALTEPV